MTKTLLDKTMTRLTIVIVVILILCIPVFYYVTTRYYAEDLIDVVKSYKAGQKIDEDIDLERDVMVGMLFQYVLIAIAVGASVLLTIRLVTKNLWTPFYEILQKIEHFKLGKDEVPTFHETNVREFNQLSSSLTDLLERDTRSYKIQKEFTENASHELQTPIAVIRADLDMLLQENLSEKESDIVDNMYSVTRRLDHLNKSLLLLAKIENKQYEDKEVFSLSEVIQELMPGYERLYPTGISLIQKADVKLDANRILVEVLVNNLVVNALRNAEEGMNVKIVLDTDRLEVSNYSLSPKLDTEMLFSRFHNPARNQRGNGLGLAIVRQVCDYYKWTVSYDFKEQLHTFTVNMKNANKSE
jgi:two-component system OmpR family sensor kinase